MFYDFIKDWITRLQTRKFCNNYLSYRIVQLSSLHHKYLLYKRRKKSFDVVHEHASSYEICILFKFWIRYNNHHCKWWQEYTSNKSYEEIDDTSVTESEDFIRLREMI